MLHPMPGTPAAADTSTMAVITWLAVGAIAGVLVCRQLDRMPGGLPAGVLAGMAGAFVGGGSFSLVVGDGLQALAPGGLACAVIGGAIVPVLLRAAYDGGSLERRPPP